MGNLRSEGWRLSSSWASFEAKDEQLAANGGSAGGIPAWGSGSIRFPKMLGNDGMEDGMEGPGAAVVNVGVALFAGRGGTLKKENDGAEEIRLPDGAALRGPRIV